ncbi:MAG: PEP-CTERM sorting domain-containing protein [Nitrospirae bacterium]|nr:PEP-CTERM sorting domain-containing protein [Nitrospirota bacterium]
MKLKRIVCIFSFILALLSFSNSSYAYFADPVSTTQLMWLAGIDFTIDGSPAQIGDEIALFIPGLETPIGLYVVDTAGQYGTMVIYGDDGTNPGAATNQALTDFRVYDLSTSTLITNVQPVIPDGCISVYCPPSSLPLRYSGSQTPSSGTLLNMQATAVPEPATSVLFITGGLPFIYRFLRKKIK